MTHLKSPQFFAVLTAVSAALVWAALSLGGGELMAANQSPAKTEPAKSKPAKTDKAKGTKADKAKTDKAKGAKDGKAKPDKAKGAKDGKAKTDKAKGAKDGKAKTDKAKGAKDSKAKPAKAQKGQAKKAAPTEKPEGADRPRKRPPRPEPAARTEARTEPPTADRPPSRMTEFTGDQTPITEQDIQSALKICAGERAARAGAAGARNMDRSGLDGHRYPEVRRVMMSAYRVRSLPENQRRAVAEEEPRIRALVSDELMDKYGRNFYETCSQGSSR